MATLTRTELLADPAAGIAAFSTRRGEGATALDPYSGFNTCDYTGDSDTHVGECRQLLHAAVGAKRYAFPRQTHSVRVAVIGDGAIPDLDGVDALVTGCTDTALCIHTADCVPIVIADSRAGVIAAVHSGWRGTVGRIAALTVEAMMRLGANPADMRAAMGPCICEECFEVGPEVVEAFRCAGLGEAAVEGEAKPRISLPRAVALTLRSCGVSSIAMPPACSLCNPLEYCSARASGIASARTVTVISRR